MGMRRDDFLLMTPPEFEAAARAWHHTHEAADRAAWLRTRRLAAILIRPHIKRPIPEEKLIPLPGDRQTPRTSPASPADPRRTAARLDAFRQQL